jgi:hypothetical protein
MTETDKSAEKKSSDDKFNPFTCLGGLLYYPALGIAIRLGIGMYGVLFSHLQGFSIVLGVLITILITIIFVLIAVFIIHLIFRFGEFVWERLFRKKSE